MNYLLHSENSKISREFIRTQDVSEFEVVYWDRGGAEQYISQGLPSPASFPTAVVLLPAASTFSEAWLTITEPKGLVEISAQVQEAQLAREAGKEVGIPIPRPDRVDPRSFAGVILLDPEVFKNFPDVLPFVPEMSTAMALLGAALQTPEQLPLVKLNWEALKLRLPKGYSEFVEEKAREFNIPIVELK